jgi:hypothetical protein
MKNPKLLGAQLTLYYQLGIGLKTEWIFDSIVI